MRARYELATLLTILLSSYLAIGQQTAAQSSAIVPRLVKFSGKATDAQGKALSGMVGVTFSIYGDENDSMPLWRETQNIHTDEAGNYTARLGATRPEGLPLELFRTSQARWLGVRVNRGEEKPRLLLLSVPYALKAADAQTLGGLPPSAFVMAGLPTAGSVTTSAAASSSATDSTFNSVAATLGGSGSPGFIPLWTSSTNLGSSTLFQSGTGSAAKVGLGTNTPASTLDVKGAGIIRGTLNLPATGTAGASKGFPSQPLNLAASSFNSGTGSAVNQNFRWETEPIGNDTGNPGATLNLLFNSGSNPPAETGLKIASNGRITFAAGQTYPGAGTVTSVGLSAPSSDFTVSGSPVTHSGNLGLNWKLAPTSGNTPNAIVKRDTTGSFAATQVTTSSLVAIGPGTAVQGTSTGSGAGISGQSGSGIGVDGTSAGIGVKGVSNGSQAIWGETTATVFSNGSGPDGVHGATHSPNGAGVKGVNTAAAGVGVWGEAPTGVGFYTPNDAEQATTAGGWVKAMAYVNASQAIVRCFNSTLKGAAATTPPCGIRLTADSLGSSILDFNFDVNDRFVSIGLSDSYDYQGGYCIHSLCSQFAKNQLWVFTWDRGGNASGANLTIFVH